MGSNRVSRPGCCSHDRHHLRAEGTMGPLGKAWTQPSYICIMGASLRSCALTDLPTLRVWHFQGLVNTGLNSETKCALRPCETSLKPKQTCSYSPHRRSSLHSKISLFLTPFMLRSRGDHSLSGLAFFLSWGSSDQNLQHQSVVIRGGVGGLLEERSDGLLSGGGHSLSLLPRLS